jgi:hypothetical protein
VLLDTGAILLLDTGEILELLDTGAILELLDGGVTVLLLDAGVVLPPVIKSSTWVTPLFT